MSNELKIESKNNKEWRDLVLYELRETRKDVNKIKMDLSNLRTKTLLVSGTVSGLTFIITKYFLGGK